MSQADKFYLLGVDGGGSGCRAALAALDGAVIGQASGGPANVSTDADQAIANVQQVILSVMHAAGLGEHDLSKTVIHIGLAGVVSSGDSQKVASSITALRCTVTDDRHIFVAGALGDDDGALVALGTGTIISARHGLAHRHVGGWGLQVSDQASGAWLGRALLERVLLCHDGMERDSDLTRATLAHFDNDPGRIVVFANGARPSDYAAFAPQIVAAAKAGDTTGADLMQRGAQFLERALDVVGLTGSDVLCLSGGLGPHYAQFLRLDFQKRIRPPRGSALDGALRLARSALEEAEVLDERR